MSDSFGARAPGPIDRAVIAATSRLPNNWLGLRLAIGLRRIVTERMSGDDGFDVEHWGLRLRLHPRRNGCEKGALFTPQMYEAEEREELFADIDKAKAAGRIFQFVDIGANVGLFSFLVASRAGAAANILAIEPEPENLGRLRFNIAANAGIPIRVIPVALGEKAGMVALDIDRRDKGGTTTRPLADGEQASVSVACRPLLDVLLQAGMQSIDALKIDVEGMEDRILMTFFNDAPVSLWPALIIVEDTRDLWRNDLFAFLNARGYIVARRSKLNAMMRRMPA
jgi:FkbM family methyltransferase